MNDLEPLITIGMPVYNGEPFLKQALDSLLAQDYTNFELIISDNASTDGTQEICLDYARRDPRIRYYRNATNVGAYPNFNRVLALSKREYFAWAGHDDLWEPSYLSSLVRLLNDNPKAVLAFSRFNSIDSNGNELRQLPCIFDLPSDDLFQRLNNYLRQHEYLGKANLICGLIRRKTLEEAGGLKLWGRGEWGSDMLIVFRLLSIGNVVLAEDTLFHKRNVFASGLHSVPPPEVLMSGIAYSTVSEQVGYFAGYRAIISLVESLSLVERIRLRLTLWRRLSRIYWYGARDVATPKLFQRVAAIKNRLKFGFKRRLELLLVSTRRFF